MEAHWLTEAQRKGARFKADLLPFFGAAREHTHAPTGVLATVLDDQEIAPRRPPPDGTPIPMAGKPERNGATRDREVGVIVCQHSQR